VHARGPHHQRLGTMRWIRIPALAAHWHAHMIDTAVLAPPAVVASVHTSWLQVVSGGRTFASPRAALQKR
ncbi:MAG: hypothetical protein ACRDKL_10150, partial [Solirubrobacteraceae bacterium]